MLAESKYQRIVLEAFKRLRTDLSPELSESELASAFAAFLDLGKTEILITRNLRSGLTHRSTYFEVWCKHLQIATPADNHQYYLSYLCTAEGRLLLPYLDDLFEAAIEIGIKWDRAEILILETLLKQKRSRKQLLSANRRSGERNTDVAARRAVLRRMGGQEKPLHHSAVCRNFDSDNIKIPESWIQKRGVNPGGHTQWQDALEKCPNLVHTLISKDVHKIRDRDS